MVDGWFFSWHWFSLGECSRSERYSLFYFLLVTKPRPPSFSPVRKNPCYSLHTLPPPPLTYFPLVGFLGIWGWDGCCEEVRRLCKRFAPSQWSQASLCPLLQFNLLLTIGFFIQWWLWKKLQFANMQNISGHFFCRQTNTNLKPLFCCYMFKNCFKLPRIFFPHHFWCLF